MNYRDAKKILNANGWVLVRSNGSHHLFEKAGEERKANMPKHGSKDLSIGVIKDLEKVTGLSFR